MSVIKKMRKQTAVWWSKGAPDTFGKFSYAGPIEFSCRWDDCGTEYKNEKGQIDMSAATVYPDRIMKPGDIVQLGDMESDTPNDPTESDTAFEIVKFERIPNFKATEFLHIAYLSSKAY